MHYTQQSLFDQPASEYFNTNEQHGADLVQANQKNIDQNQAIYHFFLAHSGQKFIAPEIAKILKIKESSARRGLTQLTLSQYGHCKLTMLREMKDKNHFYILR